MVLITSYNRPQLLLSLLKELQGENIVIFDDASDYDYTEHAQYCTYKRASFHRGKEYFWRQWAWMLDVCKRSDDDWFLFLQDDLKDIELSHIKECCNALESKYAFNICNIGSDRGWTRIKWREVDINGYRGYKMSYVDCIFACDRQALEAIDFKIDSVDIVRFKNPNISSGVGEQLSQRFAWMNVDMYMTNTSFAYHGDHESKMHKQLRQREPLVSRY